MVINHLDKLFVTNDAATIVNELEIQHPAAKILVLAAKAQQEEIGDGANLTISFAGELLQNAEELIRMGLHPSEIISGYNKAIIKQVVEVLEQLVESGSETMDVRDKDEVVSRMRAAVASKQFGQEEIICSLVADVSVSVSLFLGQSTATFTLSHESQQTNFTSKRRAKPYQISLNRRKKMQPYGIQSMLKEGYRHLSGLDEAVIKNIEACKELSTITRTSLGPNGMNKMVINHLDKLFVTNDAATIVNELEIQHPAAKILVLAAKAQQEEIGDGANLTISFAGELLQNAEELIRMGLHPSEIISGYNKAIIKVVEILEQLVESGSETMDVRDKDEVVSRMRAAVASKQFGQEEIICSLVADQLVESGSETMDVRDKDEVVSRMRAAVASKQFGQEEIICSLVADACIQVCPKNPTNFNVDNVRVAKLLGGGLQNSCIVRGMVLKSDAVGSIKRMEKAKVAVFAGGVDTTATETKGTVLIHSAEQLENYAKTEEAKVEELIKAVAESGAKVIVSGGSVGEMALHFCERYKIMVLKISSKFELRRFCRTAGAVAHLKLSRPSPDDLGYVDSISVEEIGGVTVTIARNEQGGNSISTVVLRGSTDSILDDLERAVDDGVNTYKAMCRDSRIVPGASATEIELAQRLKEYANAETGLDKYAITKYAESFEFVPKTLADNAGLNAMEIIASLYTGHGSGNTKLGIDLEEGACKDVSETKVWDLFATKLFALKYASDAACTVLRVDQIIMAKQAGGPRREAAQAAGAGAEED
ncbi:hypothetical protein DY000_02043944 [Brassica cretica]|uniref:CCT-theta n=1 Tax=Brassica cretica TaxID=69181 RepID=A0ABQ7BHB8_BRACR|nr:hypothetical protein DY000_02043944 [Brassica cretica]